jgi:hypothetical protein
MAIQTAVKMDGGAPLANCYVRVHDVSLKKDRTSSDGAKHFVSYGVSVYANASAANADPESQNALFVRELDRFKFKEVDPAGNLSALAYANLKTQVVALTWEANTGAIEDV